MYKYILIFLILIQQISSFNINPISKLNVINNGTGFIQFTSFEEYNNISINNIYFQLINENNQYYSILQFDGYGKYDIYINDEITNLTFSNNEYINNYNTSISLFNSIITPTTTLTINSISSWIILTTIILCVSSLIIIFILYHKDKNLTGEFLYSIDKLYIRYKKDIASLDIDENVHEIKLGLGYEAFDKTSTFGGIITILITIISIFIFISYFYDTLATNELLTTGYSINNNNIIPLEKSTLYTKLTFNNLFYGQCTNCINWNIWSSNIQMNTPICTEKNNNCIVETRCEGCIIDVGNDAYLYFQQNNSYIAYQFLDYYISTTSYNGNTFISGNITTDKIFTGINNTIISLSIIPTVYTDEIKKETGFILDYQNIFFGSIMNISEYNNIYNTSNKIGVTLKINRNPNWLHITNAKKITLLEQFSELYGLIGGLWAISFLLINIITSKPIRRFLYLPFLFYKIYIKEKNIIDINDKIQEIERKYIK